MIQDARVQTLESAEYTFDMRSVAAFLQLPGLRALWSMSSVAYTNPQALDISGNGQHLTNNNSADFGRDGIAPYVNFDGVNQYLSRADGGAGNWADIRGNETYIVAADQGLSVGGWFYWAALPGAVTEYLMAKDDGGANRQYRLDQGAFGAADTISFTVWPGPVALTGGKIVAGWNFCAGVFNATDADLTVYVNGDITTGGVIAAPLADTGAAFTIGASAAPGSYFTGRASKGFLCAAAIPDAVLNSVFNQTRQAFQV
jgi:hypothetical protein